MQTTRHTSDQQSETSLNIYTEKILLSAKGKKKLFINYNEVVVYSVVLLPSPVRSPLVTSRQRYQFCWLQRLQPSSNYGNNNAKLKIVLHTEFPFSKPEDSVKDISVRISIALSSRCFYSFKLITYRGKIKVGRGVKAVIVFTNTKIDIDKANLT